MEDGDFQWPQKILAMFFCFFLAIMLPTVALYYIWFLLIATFIFVVNVCLNAVLKVLNSFPLFAVILYLRIPTMFPASVVLEMNKSQ